MFLHFLQIIVLCVLHYFNSNIIVSYFLFSISSLERPKEDAKAKISSFIPYISSLFSVNFSISTKVPNFSTSSILTLNPFIVVSFLYLSTSTNL